MDKLFSIVKIGKIMGFEMPDGSRLSCECIGDPYREEIIAASNALMQENERFRQALERIIRCRLKDGDMMVDIAEIALNPHKESKND